VHTGDRSTLLSSAEIFGTNSIPRLIIRTSSVTRALCYNKLVAYDIHMMIEQTVHENRVEAFTTCDQISTNAGCHTTIKDTMLHTICDNLL